MVKPRQISINNLGKKIQLNGAPETYSYGLLGINFYSVGRVIYAETLNNLTLGRLKNKYHKTIKDMCSVFPSTSSDIFKLIFFKAVSEIDVCALMSTYFP